MMGAEYDSRSFPTDDKQTITKRWADMVDTCLSENGHQYSGCIGMLGDSIQWIDCEPKESKALANEFIEENHEKWQSGLGVPYLYNKKNEHEVEEKKIGYLVGGWCSS